MRDPRLTVLAFRAREKLHVATAALFRSSLRHQRRRNRKSSVTSPSHLAAPAGEVRSSDRRKRMGCCLSPPLLSDFARQLPPPPHARVRQNAAQSKSAEQKYRTSRLT